MKITDPALGSLLKSRELAAGLKRLQATEKTIVGFMWALDCLANAIEPRCSIYHIQHYLNTFYCSVNDTFDRCACYLGKPVRWEAVRIPQWQCHSAVKYVGDIGK